MSLRDKEIIKRFQAHVNEKGMKKLYLEDIADLKNMSLSNLNKKLADEKAFIDFECLEKLNNSIKSTLTSKHHERLKPFIKELLIEQSAFEEQEAKNKTIRQQATIKALGFMSASSSVFMSVISLDNLEEILKVLFDSKSNTKELSLMLDQARLPEAIQRIELWAYSPNKNGDFSNFTDTLDLKLFVPQYTIFAEMMAGVVDGEFTALIGDEEGFSPMTTIGKSLLHDEILCMAEQHPEWQLLKNPTARALEAILRNATLSLELEEYLVPIVLDYEQLKYQPLVTVYGELKSLIADIENTLGETDAGVFEDALEYLKLKNA
jgi:hypothetical protein